MSSFFNKYAEKAQRAANQAGLSQYIPPQIQQHLGPSPSASGTTTPNPNPQDAGPANTNTNVDASGGGTPLPPSTVQGQPPTQSQPQPQPQTQYQSQGAPAPPPPQSQQQQLQTAATTATSASGEHRAAAGTSVADMLRTHGFGTLQNHLRGLQIQYTAGNDRQIQLAITAQKSVSLQFEGAGKDAQMYSKELYLWGQDQPEDIKDVTDRVAYLNFVHGSISTDLAGKLDIARGAYKTARATESTASTLRNTGQGSDAVTQESEVEKRNALKQGEAARWRAMREYAEKLLILSQAAEVLIDECLPDTPGQQYTAKQRTAEIRSTLQHEIDNWHPNPAISATSPFKSSPPAPPVQPDPRSFGETHRTELSRTPSVIDKQRADQAVLAQHAESARPGPTTIGTGPAGSTGVNPARLNNAPAPVPVPSTGSGVGSSYSATNLGGAASSPTVPPTAPLNIHKGSGTGAAAVGASVAALSASSPSSLSPSGATPVVAVADVPHSNSGGSVTAGTHPTVAETGVPIASAIQGGPGPASGSLRTAGPGPAAGSGAPPSWSDPAGAGGQPKYESAEEEKKRLEREDRERFLRFGTGLNKPAGSPSSSAPPYASGGGGPGPSPTAAAGGSSSAPPLSAGGGRPQYESADDEKKRLEREERERILRGQQQQQEQPPRGPNDPNQDGDQLPSYRE